MSESPLDFHKENKKKRETNTIASQAFEVLSYMAKFSNDEIANLSVEEIPPVTDGTPRANDQNKFEESYRAFIENPYRYYAHLREHKPVHWDEARKAWLIFRHDDIVRIERSDAISYSERFQSTFNNISPEIKRQTPHLNRLLSMHLGHLDGEVHRENRKLFELVMSSNQINTMQPVFESLVDRKLKLLLKRPAFDIIVDFATPLPLEIMCAYLGLDEKIVTKVQPLVIDMLGHLNLMEGNESELEKKEAAVIGLTQLMEEELQKRIASPRECMISKLANTLDGTSSKLYSAVCILIQSLTGSYESIRNAIGLGFMIILNHPESINVFHSGNSQDIDKAISEFLRYDGMVQRLTRTATKDIEIDGTTIKAGQRIFLLPGSGNHDTCQFNKPDKLDLKRSPNRHLSFGTGSHYCPGYKIAKLSLRIALSSLTRELPKMNIDTSAAVWDTDERQRSLLHIPVAVSESGEFA